MALFRSYLMVDQTSSIHHVPDTRPSLGIEWEKIPLVLIS
jgi:hypothetical protein